MVGFPWWSIRLLGLLMLLGCIAPGAAFGDDSSPDEHVSRALQAYRDEHFETAISEYRAAYSLKPDPTLWCNLGGAYRKLGQTHNAIEAFYVCLRTDAQLSPDDRAKVEKQLDDLCPQDRPHPLALVPAPDAIAATHACLRRLTATPLYKRWWVWTIAGVAAASLAVGLGVGLTQPGSPPFAVAQ